MKNLFNERLKFDFLSLSYLSLCTFTALSLFSYHPGDLSFSSKLYNWEESTHNICGYLGSFLSDGLYQVFGLGAWFFVVLFFTLFWMRLLSPERKMEIEKVVFFFVVLFSFCLSLSFFQNFYLYGGGLFAGGYLGQQSFELLYPLLSKGGIVLLVLLSLTLSFLVFTESSLEDLLNMDFSFQNLFGSKEDLEQEPMEDGFVEEAPESEEPAADSSSFFSFSKKNKVEEAPTEEDVEEATSLEDIEIPIIKRSQNSEPSLSSFKISPRQEEEWELPGLELLGELPEDNQSDLKDEEIQNKAKLLQTKLEQFNVKGRITGIKTGPAVTLFEYKPNVDVKISKITELADDLSLALSSESVRIIAPIPGRDVVGIETSNSVRGTVYLKEILTTSEFWNEEHKIPIGLGKKADGQPMVVDLRKMPHLLVAGSTGSGKSVFVVSTITSLLMRYSPEDLRLVMVDPKQVDLAAFDDLPHLILPIIKEPKKAISALRWAIREMDKRYRSMAQFGARNLESFNEAVEALTDEEYENHENKNEVFKEHGQGDKGYYYEKLPYIVIIVEEFGDVMAVDKSNVEGAIVRLAQMARACGIHLILAMQSPRKDVVTGLIKTNIPGRISFKVASKMDSRVILDESGGERLLARGDMLFLAPGHSKPLRAHGSWAPEDVITEIVEHWKDQGEPEYLLSLENSEGSAEGSAAFGVEEELDERYDEILDFVSTQKTVSASLLQRRFRLGYPRAARIIEDMESQGVVGPQQGSKPRKVLISPFSEKDSV